VLVAVLGLGLATCDEEPQSEHVIVPSNATGDLSSALPRLLEAGLRISIREFPPNPCGIGLEGYSVRVQTPRAPARVKRGSTIDLKVGSSPIPSPTVRADAPDHTIIPDLVGLTYSDAMKRLEGIWVCLDEVPPLTPEASVEGFDAYIVADQDLDPGMRVPYGGARMMGGGYSPTVLHVRLALRGEN
jgi:beta-lactam-binding protein with PASTA domain